MGLNDPLALPIGRPVPLPSELRSDYDGQRFRSCIVCRRDFTDGSLYQVQKIIRGQETIFEMASCEGCARSLGRELSEESLQALKGFFVANFKPSCESWQCHFCGLPRLLSKSHMIAGICRKDLLLTPLIVLCECCGEKLQAGLSRRTREAQDEFLRTLFPGVPLGLRVVPSMGGLLL